MKNRFSEEVETQTNSSVFTKIYATHAWGGEREKSQFYSGSGSYNPNLDGYIEVITTFIVSQGIKEIVEIGCGDFNVTSQILGKLRAMDYSFSYVGYDVVEPLILHHQKLYQDKNIKFVCKDASTDSIKDGELLLIRQVLQHLNNRSILQIVKKFKDYKYIIATEHQLPVNGEICITPNLDKKTDGDIRLRSRSGVYLELEPFNCNVISLMYEMPEHYCGIVEASINTFLIKGHV